MTCLILPGERWQTLLPEPLVSSIKSVAKHSKDGTYNPNHAPLSTRCSTLLQLAKNVALRRGRGAFWGGPRLRLCSGSSLFASATAWSHHTSRTRNHLTTGTQWSSISCAMRLRVACSLRAEPPLRGAGYGCHRFSARCLASVWLQAFFPVGLPISKASK